jgi:hypothetical protein
MTAPLNFLYIEQKIRYNEHVLCIKSRLNRRQPASPGKVEAITAMRPINGNEAGAHGLLRVGPSFLEQP